MKKNLLLGLAGVAMFVGCRNCGCTSCGSSPSGGHVQAMSQTPSSPSTPALAGRGAMQGAQPIMPTVAGPQQMTPQNGGMVLPSAMSAKPGGMESMTR
jgi:hypothetical protein